MLAANSNGAPAYKPKDGNAALPRPQKIKLSDDDFVLADLHIGTTKDEVFSVFGQPVDTEEFTLPYFAGSKNLRIVKYSFADGSATIGEDNDCVYEIKVTTAKYKTTRGIKIGDSFQAIRAAYGQETFKQRLNSGNMCYSYGGKGALQLSFEVNSVNQVVSIGLDVWSD